MKLYMKQKVFSWHERFFVKDENEETRFSVKGELLSIGKKLHIYDANEQELAFIHQKVFAMMPKFFIEIGGKEVCEIVREFTPFKMSYKLVGLPWHLDGNFLEHEYSLTNTESGQTVMELSKKWLSWGDSYELEIAEEGDALMCVCVALAVESVLEEQRAVDTAGAAHAHNAKPQ